MSEEEESGSSLLAGWSPFSTYISVDGLHHLDNYSYSGAPPVEGVEAINGAGRDMRVRLCVCATCALASMVRVPSCV